jgi:fructosamine-3-kinase
LRAAAADVRVPEVLAVCDSGDVCHDAEDSDGRGGPAWLALEWLERGPRGADFGERVGRGLAALHRVGTGGWGWEEDNFIGSLPQENRTAPSWAEFWRERRLEPQLRRARDVGRMPGSAAQWDALFARLPDALAPAEADGPSLLHGDLWSGNVLAAADGPALIDPAVYRGHREADLAMADLFGGFDARFQAAYREAWPLAPGYERERRPIYQLYYVMVHVNLFGGSYVQQAARLLGPHPAA